MNNPNTYRLIEVLGEGLYIMLTYMKSVQKLTEYIVPSVQPA